MTKSSDNLPYEKVDGEIHCISDLAPFEIPDTWEWCRVGDLFTNMSGLAYKKDSLNVKSDNMVRVLRGGNIGNEEFYFKDDDVWISSEFVKQDLLLRKNYMITPAVSSLEHIGKIALIDKDYSDTVVGGFVLMLIPYFCADELSQYLLYAFDAKNHRDNCRNITHKSGQAFYNLSRERLMNLPVPLPPKEELKRINAQLKNILPFVSEYAKIDDKINTLNKSFPDVLKKSVLQQAVMGKLVPQDENDEQASVLLDRIRTEKNALIKAGKLKKDKHESIIYRRDNSHYEKIGVNEKNIEDSLPFEIPCTWEWVRLKELCVKIGSGSTPTGGKANYVDEGIKFLRSQNVYNDGIRDEGMVYITELVNNQKSGSIVNSCDILLNITGGSIGRCAIVPEDFDIGNVNQHVMIIRLIDKKIRHWVHAVIISPYIQKMIMDVQVGVSREGLSASKLMDFLIPIPPQDEMSRILSTMYNTTELLI